jgi:tRNA(Ile)-lysidine synthase
MAVRQAIVRRAVESLTGTLRDLAFRHVKRVIDFSRTPTSTRRMDLALGIETSIESQSLVLRKRAAALFPGWEKMPLPIPGAVSIRRPDWTVHIAQSGSSGLPASDAAHDPWIIRVDGDKIHPPLFLRKRESGDRFSPAGMPGAVKLNDFLAARHLPLAERDRWPLVCDGEGILWIPGYRLRQGAALTVGSTHCVEIRIEWPTERME